MHYYNSVFSLKTTTCNDSDDVPSAFFSLPTNFQRRQMILVCCKMRRFWEMKLRIIGGIWVVISQTGKKSSTWCTIVCSKAPFGSSVKDMVSCRWSPPKMPKNIFSIFGGDHRHITGPKTYPAAIVSSYWAAATTIPIGIDDIRSAKKAETIAVQFFNAFPTICARMDNWNQIHRWSWPPTQIV